MNFIVDKTKALKKWSQVLDNLKVSDDDKRTWMAEYAEMHKVNENTAYATLTNGVGMGAVTSPVVGHIPGGTWTTNGSVYGQDLGGTRGSGDIAQNLLPVSMKIAAHTIGLDLVAVKPTSSPRVEMLFVDFNYDANPDLSDSPYQDERPLVFKFNCTEKASVEAYLKSHMRALTANENIGGYDKRGFVRVGTTGGLPPVTEPAGTSASSRQFILEFLGFSRVDGYPMFRVFRQNNNAAAGSWYFDDNRNTFPNDNVSIAAYLTASGLTVFSGSTTISGVTGALSTVDVQLVSTMEDHLPGFVSNWNLSHPMTRDEHERTYAGKIGTNVFTKSVQIGDIEISSYLKRTQIEDIKASTGMDIVQKLESVLINDLTQTISKEIVQKIKDLGEQNRLSNTTPKTSTGLPAFDFDVDTYVSLAGAAPGGETYHSIQRKLIAKMNNASNFIATEGRIGPAQYAVTNGNLASVVQDVANYQLNQPNITKINTNGQLYPLCNIGSIAVYVDPYMRWDNNKIYLGRKNSVDQPGIIFSPYLMAQTISLISEATAAPRLFIRSRYAIFDVGFFPEKQFMAIHVTDTNGVLI